MTERKIMSKKSLRKYLPLIKLLTEKQIPRKSFECLIQNLDEKAITFICECVPNIKLEWKEENIIFKSDITK